MIALLLTLTIADATAAELLLQDAIHRCNAGEQVACDGVHDLFVAACRVERQVIPRAQWAAWLKQFQE